ncbi:nedd8-conjugating enzyme UbcE2M [Lepeophtheirus salmonis]|uniref:E2 NEDD8-conjugating enzyme n=2 Tax=Lepeophtheirus salmonis TaxID=72036 RepID=C1BTZ3_LEPSM|nr:NEDD8-conjugating enzyme Ubc12-like [Lepeophtheirus salmonis]ACO12496.1 NEDD8-conjugating enzyme Ubc12 [Lepeophtheirus salmonis]ADD38730.1 NEDD8-conjugating enzyme Ubc12 [Lepeophtheirus salmonis]
MLNLFTLKKEKQENASGASGDSCSQKKRASAAQLRITKDINELELPKTCKTEFPDPDDLLQFKLYICPDEGYYRDGRFVFTFKIGASYPHEPPKVKCETKVYHPNIDLEGNVCLNILREDWKPVLTINSIVYGLQYLFLEPNPEDPLNKQAAIELQRSRREFEFSVRCAMNGDPINGIVFEKCLRNSFFN